MATRAICASVSVGKMWSGRERNGSAASDSVMAELRSGTRRPPNRITGINHAVACLLSLRGTIQRRQTAPVAPGAGGQRMHKSLIGVGVVVGLAVIAVPSHPSADRRHRDLGSFVASQLAEHSEQLFGFDRPLEASALGPYDGADNLQAIQLAPGLRASLVSSSVASDDHQMEMWPH